MDLHKYDLYINPGVHVSNGDFDVLITGMHIFLAGRTAFFGFVLGAQDLRILQAILVAQTFCQTALAGTC